jgi:hypothetical protein
MCGTCGLDHRRLSSTPINQYSGQHSNTSLLMRGAAHAGWFRHALNDPNDMAAQYLGKLMSKEYGAHEPAHTEHHLYRDHKAVPAQQHHDQHQAGSQQQQQQQQQQQRAQQAPSAPRHP